MRIIFMGTPDFAVPGLQAIAAAGHELVAVYSQPPRPAGRRGLSLTKSPVHIAAEALNLPVYTPTSLRSEEEQAIFAAHKADAAIVVAYGLLLPAPVLEAPKHGCFNGHASDLPRWRGAAPIQRALMEGDHSTAMCVMKMETGLDTGPVVLRQPLPLDDNINAGQLHDQLAQMAADLLVQALDVLPSGGLEPVPQAEQGVTYASKIDKTELRIDWSQDAHIIHNHIRGLSPAPGAWCEMKIGDKWERVKILSSTWHPTDEGYQVNCDGGALWLTRLQRAGGKPLDWVDFARGAVIQDHR